MAAVVGVGVVVYRRRRAGRGRPRRELACIERAQATATIAMLAPADNVDAQGRLDAMQTLGKRIDDC